MDKEEKYVPSLFKLIPTSKGDSSSMATASSHWFSQATQSLGSGTLQFKICCSPSPNASTARKKK